MNAPYYARMLKTAFFTKTPTYLMFFITSRCNAKCRHCFYWESIEAPKRNELTLDEIEKVSQSLGNLAQLTLTGGEPFLRGDIPEISKIFAKNNKVLLITVPTNGLLPERIGKLLPQMLEGCPNTFFRISLSVDGIGDKHDYIRGVKGNFDKVIQTYEVLNKLRETHKNLNVDSNVVFASYNQHEVIDIMKYLMEHFKFDNIYMNLARGDTKEKVAKDVSLEKYRETLDFYWSTVMKKESRPFSAVYRALLELTQDTVFQTAKHDKMIYPCVAGKKIIVMNEVGDVDPCEILRNKKMGNIRDVNYDIKKILHSDRGNEVKKFIKDTNCHCTYECATNANLVYNPKSYPKLAAKIVKNLIR